MPSERPQLPHVISISTATFVKAVLIIVGLWLLWFLRDIVAIFFASVLLAALIDPFADWFAKHRINRGVAVVIVYIALGLLTTLVVMLLVPVIVEQTIQLLSNLADSSGGFVEFFNRFQTFSVEHGLQENLNASIQSIQDQITGTFTSLFSTVKGVIGGITALFVVLVLTFYMVIEEDAAKRYFKNFAPIEYQPYLAQLITKMQKKIGAWMRGQIVLGFVVGIAVYIGLSILGVQYALLLAVIAGLLEIIPYMGPTMSLIPAVIIGFAQSPLKGIFVIVLYFIIQQLENNILVPKIMQRATGLNPIVSIVALLIGIQVGGLIGAILSIPVATMGAVILEDLFAEKTV